MVGLYVLILISVLIFFIAFFEKSRIFNLLLKLTVFSILIPIIFFLSFILHGILDDGNYFERILISSFYFICFFTLQLFIFFNKKLTQRNKFIFLLAIVPFYPTLFLSEHPTDYYSTTFNLGICGTLWSIIDIISDSHDLYLNRGKLDLIYGIKTKNPLIIYQTYSILFVLVISMLSWKLKIIYGSSFKLYSKYRYIFLIVFGISFLFVFGYQQDQISGEYITIMYKKNSVWQKNLIYLMIYYSIIVLFVIYRSRMHHNWFQMTVLLLMLFFPIICATSDFSNVITADTTVTDYKRSLNLEPLVFALPMAIKYLIHDVFVDKHFVFAIRLYSLFQILMVIFLFPSCLNSKSIQHG